MADQTLRIADFSTHLSGPMASSILVGVGAEVIKIEHPVVGDGNRGGDMRIAGLGDLHVGLNPGTRSIAASTRSPRWPELVASCARWADAVIVGARPVDAVKRGLDFETMRQARPDIVYTLMTGYGIKGPLAEYAAHGQNPDALAGTVDVVWNDGMPGTRPGWRTYGSPLAGVFGALGLLAGVVRRDRGGGPQFVHASMWNTALWWNWRDINTLVNEGHGWSDYSDKGSRYSMYVAGDDKIVLACPIEKKFWQPFCDLLGLSDELRDRGEWDEGMDFGYDDERPVIAEHMRARTRDEWIEAFQSHSIPSAPVLTLQEALESEHAAVNAVMQHTTVDGKDVQVIAPPVEIHPGIDAAMDVTRREVASPPGLGADTVSALADIGFDIDPAELTAGH